MFRLLRKEIQVFFSSLIAYLVIFVFLILNTLFLWVFPGEYNILDNGFASLDNFFILAPWVFLFLIPAVTMRSFSEELKNGTFELLATKPLTDGHIVFAKFYSTIFIVVLATIPSFIYFFTVYQLGQTPGNIDVGAALGSYIGLIFLASAYSAIGVLCSSLTNNQIVSFISTVFLCFVFYMGFDSIAGSFGPKTAYFVEQFGINAHYVSLSRGLIDLKDVVYFITLEAIVLSLCILKLQSRKW
ncbi:MAG: gliding motility-associated ABC transporter permease subunit GldF [Flavobacteriales bacterium]